MEISEEEIRKILLQVGQSDPIASGNSRKCYKIGDFAVLQQRAKQDEYERSLKFQKSSQYFVKNGVNTPEIHCVSFKDGILTTVEDFMVGSPVYYRDERSYCLERNLRVPKGEVKLTNELKNAFMQEQGITIADIFSFKKEDKQAFNCGFEKYRQEQIQQNDDIRREHDYNERIAQEVKQENLAKARVYTSTSQKFYDKFLQDVITVCSVSATGLDCHPDNFLYNEESGFALIDLDATINEGSEPQPISPQLITRATSFACDILTRKSEEDEITKQILGKVINSASEYMQDREEAVDLLPTRFSHFKEDLLGITENLGSEEQNLLSDEGQDL